MTMQEVDQTKALAQKLIGQCYNHDVETIMGAAQFVLTYVLAQADVQEAGAGEELHRVLARIVNTSMRAEVEALASSMKRSQDESPK